MVPFFYRRCDTFFCIFERALIGKELSQQEREDFWESIIFYNYLQFAQDGPRKPINPEYWKDSELAFREIVETYMPDHIIVWGKRLYDGLPDWEGRHSMLQISENECTDVWTYIIKGKQIPTIKVLHPSSPKGKCWPIGMKYTTSFGWNINIPMLTYKANSDHFTTFLSRVWSEKQMLWIGTADINSKSKILQFCFEKEKRIVFLQH